MKNKIAIFSDIHGNLEALKAILEDIRENNCEEVYCLGDVIALGPNPKECMDLIINSHVNLILGNHELYYLRGTEIEKMNDNAKKHQEWVKESLGDYYKEFLKKCPLEVKKYIGNKTISLKHFLIKNAMLEYPFEELNIGKDIIINDIVPNLEDDITIIGHDHKSYEANNKNRLICLGSTGLTRDDNTFYYILEIIDNNIFVRINRVKYDRKLLEKTLNAIDYPDKNIISKYFFGINTDSIKSDEKKLQIIK